MNENSPNDATHWGDESLQYDVLHERAATIARLSAARQPSTILELGSSTGQLRREFGRFCPDADYFATDISEAALKQVPNATTACVDLNHDSIPFVGTNFDCIAGSGVLEYIDDIAGLFVSCVERLRPQGRLFVSYVNRRSLRRRLLHALGRSTGDPTWRPLIDPHQLVNVAQDAGLSLASVRGVRGKIQDATSRHQLPESQSALGRVLAWRSPQLVFEFVAH